MQCLELINYVKKIIYYKKKQISSCEATKKLAKLHETVKTNATFFFHSVSWKYFTAVLVMFRVNIVFSRISSVI